jgi:dihydroorotate dehydrogenase (NAD+) catalytic subunit
VALASGCCGYGQELDGLVDWAAVGALFTKGLSLEPRRGNAPPRIWETASGMLNAIGLENVGVEAFIRDKLPFLQTLRQRHGICVIANLFGTDVREYAALAARLDGAEDVDGVEVNLSCPNVASGGIEFGQTPEGCRAVVAAVRRATGKFVAVKLTPAVPVGPIARAVEAGGGDALSIANTMPAMAIDPLTGTPRLSRGSGGLSGPALRPIAVRMVYEARQQSRLPIIGIGGVASGEDAAEFLHAGACAVQVGTATFADPNAAGHIWTRLRELWPPGSGRER